MTDRWRDQARCAGRHINTMFPCDRAAPGSAEYLADVARLRNEMCWRCPVRAECLADGMVEEYGLWGGLMPEDRAKVMKLNCACGQPVDPKDLLSNGPRRHFCPDCRPIQYEQ